MAATWTEFWNGETTIYVNNRHSTAHYNNIAADILEHVESPNAAVIDYGCGSALFAANIAAGCRHLWLIDIAASVRRDLRARFGSNPKISIAAPERLSGVGSGTADMVVANSVVQYMSRAEFDAALHQWRRILKPGGKVVIADVVPHNASTARDAASLLKFAAANGFAGAAAAGLIRTFFSDYRTLRGRLGLTTYDEGEIIARLRSCGFNARRLPRNFGHNQGRLAFVASIT